jgi:uncharacterized protein YbjT (DUF2867 family)
MEKQSMAENIVLVTGSTGNVGREVASRLVRSGVKTVGTVVPGELHDQREKSGLLLPEVEYREFDFTDERTWETTLEGVNKLFLMRPPHISRIRRDMVPFLRYLVGRGIRKIVFLSVQGAERNPMIPHRKIEKCIMNLTLPYIFIRPSFFMQNLTSTHLQEIRDENRIFVPAGEGRTNFIDVRDIGEVAVKLLLDDKHVHEAFTITGEKSYSYDEVAEKITRITGKPCEYQHAGPLDFLSYHRKRGKKLGHRLVMLALYSVAQWGRADTTTDTVEKLLGRKPIGLEQFIEDYEPLFLGRDSHAGAEKDEQADNE